METKNIAIIGFGGRGHIYGNYAKRFPDRFHLVAVAETDKNRSFNVKTDFGADVYDDYKEMLNHGYKLDLVVVSTQDAQHKEHALYALNKGYDLLLEKPVAVNKKDCLEIYNTAKKNGRKVFVCHVLRYAKFYSTIKKIIDSGEIGDVVNIHASENVGFYHIAHSYVRGPWRNSKTSSPMILAKCCHDMDLLRYLMGERCVSVSSVGNRYYFNSNNAPKNATTYCSDCPNAKSCIFNAQKLYTTYTWPAGYFTNGELNKENILRDLKKSQYDKCVFKNDNDVVDHQSTILLFESGKTATHTMTGFSKDIYRDIKVYGTKGELVGVFEDNKIEVRPFEGEKRLIDIDVSEAVVGGHNGSDYFMMTEIWKVLNGEKGEGITYLNVSIESHLISFGAEKSRLKNGRAVKIKKLEI